MGTCTVFVTCVTSPDGSCPNLSPLCTDVLLSRLLVGGCDVTMCGGNTPPCVVSFCCKCKTCGCCGLMSILWVWLLGIEPPCPVGKRG